MRPYLKFAARALIILYFLRTISSFSGYIYQIGATESLNLATFTKYLPFFGIFLLIIVFLLLAWWKTDRLITLMVGGNLSETPLQIMTSNVELTETILRIFGMYLIVTSVPNLLGDVAYSYYMAKWRPYTDNLITPTDMGRYVTSGVGLLIGLCLMLGAPRLKRSFSSVRDYLIGSGDETENK